MVPSMDLEWPSYSLPNWPGIVKPTYKQGSTPSYKKLRSPMSLKVGKQNTLNPTKPPLLQRSFGFPGTLKDLAGTWRLTGRSNY